jgi:antitoxin (DNA-binding transcriptional repressor) of toxin-antitoxin stability system
MRTRTAQQTREHWAETVEDSLFRNAQTTVTSHDKPIAVMVPVPWWERAVTAVPLGGERVEMGIREGRETLRARLDHARTGGHTTITRYGHPAAVLTPHAWFVLAERELSDQPST